MVRLPHERWDHEQTGTPVMERWGRREREGGKEKRGEGEREGKGRDGRGM